VNHFLKILERFLTTCDCVRFTLQFLISAYLSVLWLCYHSICVSYLLN